MWKKIFFLTSIIIVFYISIKELQSFEIYDGTLNSFIYRFNLGYIDDIKVYKSENRSDCPDEYENVFNSYFWPGSYNSCLCPENSTSPKVSHNLCEEVEKLEKNCTNFFATPQIVAKSFNSFIFCVKRTGFSYLNLAENGALERENGKCENFTHNFAILRN